MRARASRRVLLAALKAASAPSFDVDRRSGTELALPLACHGAALAATEWCVMQWNRWAWPGMCAFSLLACGGRVEYGTDGFEDGSGLEPERPATGRTAGELSGSSGASAGSGGSGSRGISGSDAGAPASGGSASSGGGAPRCQGSCSGCDPETGVCYIQCVGDRTCIQADLDCPEGWPCEILCHGSGACTQARISCPRDFPCSLECSGDRSCIQATFPCSGHLCELACSGSGACTQLH